MQRDILNNDDMASREWISLTNTVARWGEEMNSRAICIRFSKVCAKWNIDLCTGGAPFTADTYSRFFLYVCVFKRSSVKVLKFDIDRHDLKNNFYVEFTYL